MNTNERSQSLKDKDRTIGRLVLALLVSIGTMAGLVAFMHFYGVIVIQRTPGVPTDAQIERSSMDMKAQKLVLSAISNAIGSINPSNAEYVKAMAQSYFAPEAYTRLTGEINTLVQKMIAEREAGSHYFVLISSDYNPQENKHYLFGEYHTVNMAKDTSQNYVFVYQMRVEQFRPVILDYKFYPSDNPPSMKYDDKEPA